MVIRLDEGFGAEGPKGQKLSCAYRPALFTGVDTDHGLGHKKVKQLLVVWKEKNEYTRTFQEVSRNSLLVVIRGVQKPPNLEGPGSWMDPEALG